MQKIKNEKPILKVDWATHKSAKYSCENWHYSKCMPAGGTVKIGVWENNKFIGVITYSLGAGNMTRGDKYGLKKTNEIVELSRVALNKHETPVSKILSISLKMLKKKCPKIKMVISFADEMKCGHHGGIYQATNWIYTGSFEGVGSFVVNNIEYHRKSIHAKKWKQNIDWLRKNIDPKAKKLKTKKHRYLMPFGKKLRKEIEKLKKPYPKRADKA